MITIIWSDATESTHPSAAAVRAATCRREARGIYRVESWPADDPPPRTSNDAWAWDSWRVRRGYSGCHH